MSVRAPTSAEELAQALKDAALKSQTVSIIGNNSKRLMSGPVSVDDAVISTAGIRRVLQYERGDLTISVEAGMLLSDLQALLADHRQMVALDPPFSTQATIGGVIASNSSGPMRRGFGTARDLVIGMTFATVEGKLVKTGGMVVKNVAGLDIGKLMIGSFGTLAVITSVNLRVHSLPQDLRTFLFTFTDLESAIEKRNEILRSVLQPMAIDLLTPAAAARLNARGYVLAMRAGGSPAVLDRYTNAVTHCEQIAGQQEAAFWQSIREFTPEFLARQRGGIVLRVSSKLSDLSALLKLVSGPCIARAGSGVTYVYLSSWQGVPAIWNAAKERGWGAVVEFAPDELRTAKELWLEAPSPQRTATFDIMKKVKHMFDPQNVLNPSRLYGRI